ncbi:hypothetical protein M5C72_06360 [Companilactobacillus allii]|uniref:Uncharacterized protein n=1 Tax=Companilactobacillus allii TaxID=1847728 RepID=A0A1P8Q4G5_9LACO|nr:hypothetical protein [Companilactobacillus allii]APX72727.1 hypothetical protein BTM29_09260 [Companilactobacillus allii]USQ67510.1 hypothetical protein M5C72_06360 [Companilactobacillus allii]
MSKITIELNDNGNIRNFIKNEYKKEGWIIVDDNPAFNYENKFDWTIRNSDNKLVHIATGMTPEEEANSVSAATLKQVGETAAQVASLATAFGAYMKATASNDATISNTEEGTK